MNHSLLKSAEKIHIFDVVSPVGEVISSLKPSTDTAYSKEKKCKYQKKTGSRFHKFQNFSWIPYHTNNNISNRKNHDCYHNKYCMLKPNRKGAQV